MEKQDRENLFNRQASRYGKRSKKKSTYDSKWRKELLAFAKGRILEVSVGAGANFGFYPKNAVITAVDLSSEMIKKARESAAESGIEAEFIQSTVEDLDLAPESFDTIVSTLSLCSYDDPSLVLHHFNSWCRKDGLILLLEHGLSKYRFIHWIQNRFDKFQYKKIGCHTNRDILGLVRNSGLRIRMYERKFLGAIYLIWAKPA
jgi:2-polyprenyl-3-methyl-5-hydroxy-6-metoxy-1,4-benzoquinol methylase